jgi:asparagine synthase (glutamine-hydrolysing)
MAGTLRHRGPDDEGAWVDEAAGIALGFRRLAIVDLSLEGRQPMASACGRYVIAFNGEIYNYRDLRRELEGVGDRPLFRGHSDTEVMLAAFARWGPEGAVRRFVGMYAFALWDRGDHVLYLGRDRIGEKPLYYGWMGDVLLFGSELRALRAHPAFREEINRDALLPYLRLSCIPAPYSIYKGVSKLLPGTLLRVEGTGGRTAAPLPYWSARAVAEAGTADPFEGTATEATDRLDYLLRQAVGLQMVADVPLGAFLSGGIDSSTIAALMQAQSPRPVKTFTIGFHEEGYDEAVHAREVARHLGTDHTELYVTPAEAMAVIPRLPTLYDEPFADSSQIPTFLISQLARRSVTVSLSGDGGDELFGGYKRYFKTDGPMYQLGRIPRPVRRATAWALAALSPDGWDRTLDVIRTVLPRQLGRHASGERFHKLAELIADPRHEAVYHCLSSKWSRATRPVLAANEPPTPLADEGAWAALSSSVLRMMHLDLITYLPDDILVKVDRASMGVGLESRAPFLDHRVVEFAWQVPVTMKIRDGQGKRLLRQVLHRYVPRALVERPKMGFCVPIDSWLRGPLSDWAEALLDEGRLRREGIFDPAPIRRKWEEHLSGSRDCQHHVWDVLMFQSWFESR